jgi:hypothetical protein
MPVEGAIPHIPGIEMFGNSIPAGTVGGDLFEYINFQQRYDIAARIQQAQRLSREFLEPLPPGAAVRNSVDDHVQWMRGTPGHTLEMEANYRFARSSEQVRVAEDLRDLYSTAGVLLVDAQGHGVISAKIASTVHDTFHALMLTELDRYGKTTPMLLDNINLRLAQSVTARNALGITEKEGAREIATMLYGEVDPLGHFRFANFGHPPPLVFSAEYRKFMKMDEDHMVQFLALGLQCAVPGFDGLDGVFKRLFQNALADGPEHEAEHPSLEVLALAYDDHVDVGGAVGTAREGVGVAGRASPRVGVGRREDDVVGIGPVVVQAFPDAARAFRDVGLRGAAAMHLEVLVGAVAKELRAARPEVGEPGDVLLGRQGGCLVEVDRGHACSFSLGGDELLSAVDVIGCAREGGVGHDVYGERGHVRRSDHASDGKRGAKLVAAFFELIAQQFRGQRRVHESRRR